MTDPVENRVSELIRAGAAQVSAPEELRGRIAAERSRRGTRRRGPARLALAGALAAGIAALVLLVGGGGPTVQEVAAAGLAVPTRPAPAADAADSRLLDVSVGGLAFPSWREPWGWRAVGSRLDTVGGRDAVTVIYRQGELGVHYTIVEGEPLPWPEEGETVRDGGRRLSVLDGDAYDVVTWRQSGRTCVLASDSVPAGRLVELAGWR